MSNIIYEIDQKADKFSDKAVEEYREEGYDDDFGEYDHQVSEEFAQEIVDDLSVAELVDIVRHRNDSRFKDALHLFEEGEAGQGYVPIDDYLKSLALSVAFNIINGNVLYGLEETEELE